MDSKRIRITLISRNRIISSDEDRKLISKVSKVEPYEDVTCHYISMELYDTSPEVRGIVQTIVYDYFSCFKDYDAASKSNKVEDLTDGLI